jgi:hypothetical protein
MKNVYLVQKKGTDRGRQATRGKNFKSSSNTASSSVASLQTGFIFLLVSFVYNVSFHGLLLYS